MRNKINLTTLLVLAAMAFTVLAPLGASADSQQKNKNNWRNITIGAGAIGVYGLLNHNSTATILGGLGAAYAGSQYERARHRQSQDSAARRNYYRSHYRYYRHHYRR